jgi:hypothetical protein
MNRTASARPLMAFGANPIFFIHVRKRMTERQPNLQEVLEERTMERIELLVPADLCRAFRRCIWLRINETGESQLEIMQDMVRDFLVKHGC